MANRKRSRSNGNGNKVSGGRKTKNGLRSRTAKSDFKGNRSIDGASESADGSTSGRTSYSVIGGSGRSYRSVRPYSSSDLSNGTRTADDGRVGSSSVSRTANGGGRFDGKRGAGIFAVSGGKSGSGKTSGKRFGTGMSGGERASGKGSGTGKSGGGKNMTGKYRMRRKIGVGFLFVGGIFLVLMARVFYINYQNGDVYSKTVLAQQQYTSKVLPYKRGQILDSTGTQLAYSEKVYNLILDAKLLLSDEKYLEPTLAALTRCFDLNEQDIRTILKDKPNSQYERLLKNLTADEIKEFNSLLDDTENNPYIKGVWFEDSYIRKYPLGSLACDVIGFSVSGSSDANIGLEKQYDDVLSGTDGVSYGYINEDLNIEDTTKQPVDGNNVITTLDIGVQNIIEKHIKEFNDEYGSKNTGVIVMNPNNGEILGMASYPVFDLNNPRDLTSIYDEETLNGMSDDDKINALYDLWKNFCVSTTYEPGSTFKPFTVATALEEGYASDGDTYVCKGYEEVGGWTIKCHEKAGHGTLTLKQAIMYSCNPAMMQIAAKMGNVCFSDYQRRFGLGSKTGIDVPGEEAGILIDGDLSSSDLATNSFGQNFTVNMVQMASAFSSLINGGNYYQPHLVKRIESSNGEIVEEYGATLVKQTVTSTTSELLKEYLEATVDEGLAKNAKVAGYSMAGKTGTAQKQPRTDEKYVISFLGYASADNPKFVIYVVLDEPEVEGYTGSSQPVLWLTKSIMEDLLPYMNVFKDSEIAAAEAAENSNGSAESYDEAPLPSDMSNSIGTSNPDAAGSVNTALTGSTDNTGGTENTTRSGGTSNTTSSGGTSNTTSSGSTGNTTSSGSTGNTTSSGSTGNTTSSVGTSNTTSSGSTSGTTNTTASTSAARN